MDDTMRAPTRVQHADPTGIEPATHTSALFRSPRVVYGVAPLAVILLIAISVCVARSAGAQQLPPSSPAAKAGQKIPDILLPATLTAALDSKKKKAGDEVVLSSAAIVHLADQRLIARGAKIVGHVTEARTRSGGEAQSSLGIVFDKIDLADGRSLPITGIILAVGPNPNPSDSDNSGGVNYSGIEQTLDHATPTAGGFDKVVPILTKDSVGVLGIKNLTLGPDGVFKSDQKTLKLGFGSQIVLRARVAAGN
jgi:hypothetical protein